MSVTVLDLELNLWRVRACVWRVAGWLCPLSEGCPLRVDSGIIEDIPSMCDMPQRLLYLSPPANIWSRELFLKPLSHLNSKGVRNP